MEEKNNVAELLKNCPQGMELDCPMFENLYFEYIDNEEELYPIKCYTKCETNTEEVMFNKYGGYTCLETSRCVIFPKGKNTWEGFVPPCKFKDGDIISNGICICIYNGNENDKHYGLYVGVGHKTYHNYFIHIPQDNYFTKENARLATKEEERRLFGIININGYKWNEETKSLEKLIEPKVKLLYNTSSGDYQCNKVSFKDQYELVDKKFDIATLKPFDKVLVRNYTTQKWTAALWSFYNNDEDIYPYEVVGKTNYMYTIPYEGNEHLLGTKEDCDEYFKTWE